MCGHQGFGGDSFLHLEEQFWPDEEGKRFFQMVVNIYKTMWCHNPGDQNYILTAVKTKNLIKWPLFLEESI